jgi:histone deacetylase 1/2
MTINQAIKKLGYEAVLSVVKEIMQLNDKETFEGINTNDLTEEEFKRIITSSTFLKDKYTADGIFDKLKARLVAGGHLQDRNIYDNGGSPTASTTSVFMVAGIAAEERRAVAHVDFPGAFLNAKMPDDDGKAVYMRLNKFESTVLVKIDPTYRKFMDRSGRVTVRLKRALYGCVESARLWYEKVSKDLMDIGYVKNSQDMCVFNRTERDKSQSTIVLHVDDFLMTAKNEDILTDIIKEIEKKYEQLSVHRGRTIEYIGMKFDFTQEGKVKITMQGYIQDLLEFCKNIEGSVSTPALDNLFKVGENNKKLKETDKEFFHSVTAKLLYLGKRVRPDILTAVSFLTKRVQSPTEEDMRKLERVIRYIRGTADLGIIIEARVNLGVYAYVDASYGVHTDYKSHTGCVIGIGKGPIYAKSSTQKINSKSSSEAELIGLSDSTNQIVWVRNFLISQGYDVGEATVYEDNMSTINMVKNGKSNSERTRHIAIRFYFVADRVQQKEIKIQYMQTANMLADILTKPLQGKLFTRLRDQLLNWN